MREPDAESMALIAEATRRSVGVEVNDYQLAVALAMCDQIRQHRPRRAAKTIKVLSKALFDRRDRSLAAAFPAVFCSAFIGMDVCVMVAQDAYVGDDVELYRAILRELGASTKVGANVPPLTAGGEQGSITVATPESLAHVEGLMAVMIVRLPSKETKVVSRRLSGGAALPDP